jgi:hypothetical protein
VRRMVRIVAVAALATGCAGLELPAGGAAGARTAPAGPSVTGSAPAAAVPDTTVARAEVQLATLKVAGPRDGGYQRTRNFGPAWSVDVDRNGCGARDDVLRRDLTKVQLRGRCTVVAGVLADPYTGRTVTFTKAHAAEVQIDHGPAEWLPRAAFRCAYAVQWIGVSTRYKLAITRPDKASLTTLLARC